MFGEFDDKDQPREGRGRLGASVAIAAVILLLVGGALAMAIATARAVVERRDRDLMVEFADLPPAPEMEEIAPEPEPEAAPDQAPRPAAQRQNLGPPDEIPDERPEEAEGALVDADGVGPVDGFTDGGGGEEAPPPPQVVETPEPVPPAPSPRQVRETITRPTFASGVARPDTPMTIQTALSTQAETIRISIRLLVDAAGRVSQATVLNGHPLIDNDTILAWARAHEFEPARLPDGTAIPYPHQIRFVFRPNV